MDNFVLDRAANFCAENEVIERGRPYIYTDVFGRCIVYGFRLTIAVRCSDLYSGIIMPYLFGLMEAWDPMGPSQGPKHKPKQRISKGRS